MKRNGLFVLMALLAISLVGTAIGSGAGADPVAQTAGLKKCLKKAKRIQDPVKRKKAKRRCRKKFGGTGTGTTTGPTPAPLVRATLTWSGGGDSTDYDLYAFLGTTSARAASNPIPNTSFSSNAIGASGTETFTDLIYVNPGARNFDFGVCKQGGGNDGSTYSIDYVTADGMHHTDTQTGHGDNYAAKYSDSAPPNAPNGFSPCKVP
jgi:hypothetical protein